MKSILLLAAAAALTLGGCASSEKSRGPITDVAQADVDDLIARLVQKQELHERDVAGRSEDERVRQQAMLMNHLEHLLPSWRAQFLNGEAGPLERVITTDVVTHFDLVSDAFENGPHERRLVAAWALGFTRVPPNSEGIRSRHDDAVDLLNTALLRADDDILRNILLAYWMIGDDDAPINELRDMVVQHHDEEVRAAAMLALGACLTSSSANRATESVLVAFEDTSGKVRLHAAKFAVEYPDPAFTARLSSRVRSEPLALVQAVMARALGASGDPGVESVLVQLLGSRQRVVATNAHRALVELTGRDEGTSPSDWQG